MDDSRAGSPPSPAMRYPRVGQIMLIVGVLLLIAAFFIPWLDFTTSSGDHPGTYGYSPWFLIQSGIPVIAMAGLLAPFLAITICTGWFLISRSRRAQGVLLALLALLASLCLVGIFLLMTFILVGLNLGLYGSFAQNNGIWAAVGGFGGVLVGVFILLDARTAEDALRLSQQR